MVASTGKQNKSVGRMATTRYVLGFQYYTFHCSLSSLSSHKTPVSVSFFYKTWGGDQNTT